ncbi:MAG: glycosyltransferase family 2 protein [Kineosporiaceae bacterium]
MRGRRVAGVAWRATTWAGTLASLSLTAHTLVNVRRLRVPPAVPDPAEERVSILLPARNEAHQIAACVASLLEQVAVPDLEIVVLDDGSTDGTADVVRAVVGDDPRVRVLSGEPLPPGWLGKPWACAQLAEAATGSVLVFVDADVVFAPHAVAAAVATLRESGLELITPYPRQLAFGPAERLVQPLLQWSWLTLLPLHRAERSWRTALVAATGQFLVVDAAAYRRFGGHEAIRDSVLDDIALLQALKRDGGHGVVVDGTHLATCRMYTSWPQLREGYTKSLWTAFGSPAAGLGVAAGLGLAYVVPAVAAARGSRVGSVGYAAAVAGRYAVAERTGGRSLPDSLAHPVSVSLFGWLVARSWWGRKRGRLTWKGRALPG